MQLHTSSNIHTHGRAYVEFIYMAVSRKIAGNKRTRQSVKVIRNMVNTLFLTLWLSNLPLLLSFSTRKHTSMASRAFFFSDFPEMLKSKEQ